MKIDEIKAELRKRTAALFDASRTEVSLEALWLIAEGLESGGVQIMPQGWRPGSHGRAVVTWGLWTPWSPGPSWVVCDVAYPWYAKLQPSLFSEEELDFIMPGGVR